MIYKCSKNRPFCTGYRRIGIKPGTKRICPHRSRMSTIKTSKYVIIYIGGDQGKVILIVYFLTVTRSTTTARFIWIVIIIGKTTSFIDRKSTPTSICPIICYEYSTLFGDNQIISITISRRKNLHWSSRHDHSLI